MVNKRLKTILYTGTRRLPSLPPGFTIGDIFQTESCQPIVRWCIDLCTSSERKATDITHRLQLFSAVAIVTVGIS